MASFLPHLVAAISTFALHTLHCLWWLIAWLVCTRQLAAVTKWINKQRGAKSYLNGRAQGSVCQSGHHNYQEAFPKRHAWGDPIDTRTPLSIRTDSDTKTNETLLRQPRQSIPLSHLAAHSKPSENYGPARVWSGSVHCLRGCLLERRAATGIAAVWLGSYLKSSESL